ncbi:MAG: hypothetical protein IKH13_04140 [Clostridia bacterium]|nr:hypothetical protein [Clostridia bacterium]
MKKFLCLLLTLTMLCGIVIPAFAESEEVPEGYTPIRTAQELDNIRNENSFDDMFFNEPISDFMKNLLQTVVTFFNKLPDSVTKLFSGVIVDISERFSSPSSPLFVPMVTAVNTKTGKIAFIFGDDASFVTGITEYTVFAVVFDSNKDYVIVSPGGVYYYDSSTGCLGNSQCIWLDGEKKDKFEKIINGR